MATRRKLFCTVWVFSLCVYEGVLCQRQGEREYLTHNQLNFTFDPVSYLETLPWH